MTRTLVALCGILGILVPGYTFIASTDAVTKGLIVLIALAFGAGIWELLFKAGRVQALRDQLTLLDDVEGDVRDRIAKADPAFGKVVRARLAGQTITVSSAGFASYLITALATVGLFGTFMGMVAAVSGAHDALGIAREIDDLRQSLRAPIGGLSTAFNSSVAGIWTSFVLGLAASIVRRSEGRFVSSLNAHFTADLAQQTLAGRQLAALDRIGDQGDALPKAVTGLRDLTDRLPELQDAVTKNHVETNAAIADAVKEAAAAVQKALLDGVKAGEEAQAKHLDTVMQSAQANMSQHLEAWAKVMQDTAVQQRDAEAKRQEDLDARFQNMVSTYEEVLQRRADEFAKGLADAAKAQSEQHEKAMAADDKRRALDDERDARLQKLLDSAQEAAASQKQLGETLAQLAKALPAELQQFQDKWVEDRQAHQQLLDDKGAQLMNDMRAQQQEQVASIEDGARDRIESFAAALDDKLGGVMSNIDERTAAQQEQLQTLMTQLSSSEEAHKQLLHDLAEQHTEKLDVQLKKLQSMVDVERESQTQAMATWIEQLQDAMRRRQSADDKERAEVLAQLVDEAKALASASTAEKEAHREAVAELQRTLDEERQLASATFAEQLSGFFDKQVEQQDKAQEQVDTALEALLSGSVDLAATAERFSDAVDAFRSAKEQLALPTMAPATTASAEAPVAAPVQAVVHAGPEEQFGGYLEHTKDLFDTSLQLQRALFEEIQALREGRA